VLPEDGPIVAPPDVPPHAWVGALPGDASVLVLAPGSARGWFGGRAVVAWAPEAVAGGLTPSEAADGLQRAYSGEGTPRLTAALLPYTGAATIARYPGGLVHTPQGWRAWGEIRPSDVPTPVAGPPAAAARGPLALDLTGDMGEAEFVAGVRAIGDAIRAGDVYVVNLTRRLAGTPAMPSADAFAALTERTCADMGAYWRIPGGRAAIASASPERFVRLRQGLVEVCPIKGTRPRGPGATDSAMRAELAASPKERAEHVMIVDLERNDLGRVCAAGSIRVDPLFEIVTTTYCHQMVSTVSGLLREEVSIADLLDATFPCGSVTGAPKIAAMRTIERLETSPRGAYTGSLVVAVPGELDSSVLIRTAEYGDCGVIWGTGGGITVDSEPDDEWLETVLKASPFAGDVAAGAA